MSRLFRNINSILLVLIGWVWGIVIERRYSLQWRIKTLIKREVTLENIHSGEKISRKLKISEILYLVGPTPKQWWWVRKWGTKACGCIQNPITRKSYLKCRYAD